MTTYFSHAPISQSASAVLGRLQTFPVHPSAILCLRCLNDYHQPAHPSPVLCLRCSDNYQLTLRTRQQFCVRGARNTTDFPCGHAAHLTAAARTPFLQPLTRGNTSGISPLGWPTTNNFSTCVQPQAPRPKAGPPLRTSQRSRLLRDNDKVTDEHRARPSTHVIKGRPV